MIELDYVGLHNAQVSFMEMSQPRGMSWSASMPLTQQNVYVFVNAEFEVVKKFNTDLANEDLLEIISKANTRAVSSHHQRSLIWAIETPWQAPLYETGDGYYKIYSSPITVKNTSLFTAGNFGEQGIIDSLGNIVVPIVYEDLHGAGQYLIAKEHNMIGVIDFANNIVLPFEYDSYEATTTSFQKPLPEYYLFYSTNTCNKVLNRKKGVFLDISPFNFIELHSSGNFFICSYKNKFGVLNSSFETTLPFEYDCIEAYQDSAIVVAHQNNKWGLMNYKNEIILPFEYDDYFRNDWRRPMFLKDANHFTFENGTLRESNEEEIQRFKYSIKDKYNAQFIKGHPIVQRDNRFGILDSNLNVQVPLIYSKISPIGLYNSKERYHQSLVIAEVNKLKGIIDLNNQVLLPFEYDDIQGYINRDFFLIKNNKRGLCDSTLKITIPIEYTYLDFAQKEGQVIFSHDGKKMGIMTLDQHIILPEEYDRINGYYYNFYLLTNNELKGICDLEGKVVIPTKYEELAISPYNELLLFKQKDKWGIMTMEEKVILPAEYDQINVFQKNITGVRKGDKWAFVNEKGKFKTEFIYDHISYSWDVNDLTEVTYNGQVGFLNSDLKVVINFLYDDCVGYSRDGYHFIKDNLHYWVKP